MKISDTKSAYYVYIYLDPRKQGKFTYGDLTFEYEPYYVGKGIGRRMFEHLRESDKTNSDKKEIIKSILKNNYNIKEYILQIKTNMVEIDALKFETDCILKIGRLCDKTGPLTNKKIHDGKAPSDKAMIFYVKDLKGNITRYDKGMRKFSNEYGTTSVAIKRSINNNTSITQGKLKGYRFSCDKNFSITNTSTEHYTRNFYMKDVEGNISEHKNLQKFHRENDIGVQTIMSCIKYNIPVQQGKFSGYRFYDNEEEAYKESTQNEEKVGMFFYVRLPSEGVTQCKNLKKFCRENKIPYGKVIQGVQKGHYKIGKYEFFNNNVKSFFTDFKDLILVTTPNKYEFVFNGNTMELSKFLNIRSSIIQRCIRENNISNSGYKFSRYTPEDQ